MAKAGNDRRRNAGRSVRKEGAKILPFRRELTLNLGLIIFLFILLYLAVSLIRSATRESYASFRVAQEESLNGSQTYRALILRSEQIINSRWAGYVDLFAPEGGHVAVGSVVTSVDEVGSYSQKIKEVAELQSLSKEEMRSFKNRLRKLALNYDSTQFSSVYETHRAVSAFFSTHVGRASLEVLESDAALNEFFHIYKSDTGGTVLYYKDGFEGRDADSVTARDFENKDYQRETTAELVTLGDFLYKLVDSEKWTLMIPLTAEEAARYEAMTTLDITFVKNDLKTRVNSQVVNGADGSLMLRLDLSRYLVQFASDRFTEIRIEQMGQKGYKIPGSCRVSESVFMIPRAYEAVLEDGTTDGFYQEIKNGADQTIRHIFPTVYRRDEEYCYVSREELPAESILIKPNSQERYTVRLSTVLEGVYQVNAGFTRFCPIQVLEESGDYLLVERGTAHGIATYDEILLNASRYQAGQILR